MGGERDQERAVGKEGERKREGERKGRREIVRLNTIQVEYDHTSISIRLNNKTLPRDIYTQVSYMYDTGKHERVRILLISY